MKLHKLLAGVFAGGLMLCASSVMAQEEMVIGGDGAFLLPLGDCGNVAGPLIGVLGRFEYNLSPALAITGRTGFMYGLQKSQPTPFGDAKYSINNIPLWSGAKYYFGGEPDGFYGAAELGLNYMMYSSESPSAFGGATLSYSDSKAKVGTSVGAGYKLGDLDFRGSLSFFDIGHAGDSMGLLLNVGYNFAKF